MKKDEWYKIRLRFNDIDKKVDVWINEVLKASNIDVSGNTSDYTHINVTGGNDTHTRTWFDDIKVWYED